MFKFIADNNNPHSLASQARKKRFNFFLNQFKRLKKPLKILDIGGTQNFWEAMNFINQTGIEIYLLNLEHQKTDYKNFFSLKGDATNLEEFENNSFDLVFSNSVIEHLYTFNNQVKMAKEVLRVGRNYFIQVPNYWFPIEPHFVFPCFQYLPKILRFKLITTFALGHYDKFNDEKLAKDKIEEINLLTIKQMMRIFPGCKIYLDKIFFLNKSIVAFKINE